VYVESHTVLLKENSVHLRLTLIDTPDLATPWTIPTAGIPCWTTSMPDSRSSERRAEGQSSRVHCVLYFIAPTGHGLKPLDIEFMKRLARQSQCAKADCMTLEELRDFKKTILNELAQHKIRVYDFPESHPAIPMPLRILATMKNRFKRLKDRLPFAVVGANCLVESASKGSSGKVRGRAYPWGSVRGPEETTNSLHYENYRYLKLSGIAQESKFRTTDGKDPMAQMETEKRDHELKMRKMESEMEEVFEMKVKEKKQKLKRLRGGPAARADQMRKNSWNSRRPSWLPERRAPVRSREARLGVCAGSGRRRRLRRHGRRWRVSATMDAIHSKEKSKSEKKKGLFK
uniref:Septin-type G domain-containing protein n=1 Tax=Macrostomum lignano TaxID=282301 RepID=A0A1I8FCU4_9PLAT